MIPRRELAIVPVNRLAAMVQLIPREGLNLQQTREKEDRLGDDYQHAVAALVQDPTAYFRVALDEHFDALKLAWPHDPLITARRVDGGYRITPRGDTDFAAIGAPLGEAFRDVVVGATFRKLGGPENGVYGVLLRDLRPEEHSSPV